MPRVAAAPSVGAAGDVVVLTAHGLVLRPDGSYTVVPEGGNPWLLARRRQPGADS
jgi:hypothetical protein